MSPLDAYKAARSRADDLRASAEYLVLFGERFLLDARRAAGDRTLSTFTREELDAIARSV